MSEVESSNAVTLIDTHVHLHSCYEISKVFAIAARNFQKRADRLGQNVAYSACMLLTEMAGETWFIDQRRQLAQTQGPLSVGDGWSLQATSEPLSLLAVHPSGARLALIAGRQVVTQERLEVLALVTSDVIPDERSLDQTVQAIVSAKGVPVLPWGVGKWIGRRGKLVADYLQQNDNPRTFLGDNSGRPLGWKRPAIFALSEQKGVPILPGTDPLALTSEITKIGRCGIQLPGQLDVDYPGKMVYEALQELSLSVEAYSRLENPLNFVKNQVALRLQKIH